MTKILVTGGLGYIGSHTVTCLISAGFDVVVIDNLSNSSLEVLEPLKTITGSEITFRKVEMQNQSELDSVFQEFPDISGVIHFAALLQVKESVEQPVRYYQNNLTSTLNLIKACEKFGVKDIVFSSSCTVYGQPKSIPVNESEPIKQAESPYGSTKIMCEQILKDASNVLPIKVVSLRYFNPIGAHESALIGERYDGIPHHLVPYITETAIGKRDKLNVFGGDYNTRDGSCVRDYIHVMDIAEAHVKALKFCSTSDMPDFEAINLGSGEGQTVLEMIKAFEKATGLKVPYSVVDRRSGDVEKVYADISKAKRLMNWNPKRGLEETLLSAWKWEQKR